MRFYEFKTTTPQQARINLLKQQKERASANLKAEKNRQKRSKALANISKNNEVIAKLNAY